MLTDVRLPGALHLDRTPEGLEVYADGPDGPVEWLSAALPPDEMAVLRTAATMWHDGRPGVLRRGHRITLDATALCSLSDHERELLGLSDGYTGELEVLEHGIPEKRDFHIRWRWVDGPLAADGAPAAFVGPTLRPLPRTWLPLLAIAQGLDAPDETRRYRALASLQALAEDEPRIRLGRVRRATRIDLVDQVRIALERDADGNVLPVAVLAETDDDGRVVTTPLSPDEVDRVANATLGIHWGSLKWWQHRVLITREASQNLAIVRAARSAPEAERARFVENPENFLPFPDAFDRGDYADRVVGLAPPPPTPPRAAAPAADWLLNTGVLLDGPAGSVWVAGPRVPEVRADFEGAIARGEPTLRVDGVAIPARPEVVDHLLRLEAPPEPPKEGEPPVPKPPMLVLAIRENVEAVDYQGAERPRPDPRPDAPIPAGVRAALKEHQLAGLHWLRTRWTSGVRGALLCDDMGLGKTLQALVFATWVRERLRDVDLPVVLVAPVSLLDNWLEEIRRHLTPGTFNTIAWGQPSTPPDSLLPLADFLDTRGANTAVLQENRLDLPRLVARRPDLVLMSYDTLRRYQLSFGRAKIGLLILDEAQQIKHDHALRSRAARAMNYDFGLALTGTPIENRWDDLWTIADFAVPGFLGPAHAFRKAFPQSGDVQATGALLGQTAAAVLLRRTRAQALTGLPELRRSARRAPMPEVQRMRYVEAAATTNPGGMLQKIHDLARIALHPRVQAQLAQSADAHEWVAESARTSIAWEPLAIWARERRPVLLFARSLAFQETLRAAIDLCFKPSHPTSILNGKVPPEKRSRLVQRFQDATGFRALIVSPDVGGTGWNLQFSARAILLERPWNPAVEAQIIARQHRLGQREHVEVVIPIGTLPPEAGRSFDEILHGILGGKLDLFESVLAPIALEQGEFQAAFSEQFRPPTPLTP